MIGSGYLLGDQTRGRMDCATTVKAVRELIPDVFDFQTRLFQVLEGLSDLRRHSAVG